MYIEPHSKSVEINSTDYNIIGSTQKLDLKLFTTKLIYDKIYFDIGGRG